MSTYDVNPTTLMYDSNYPSPESDSTPQPEQSNKKKRKAWGQPVPPINPILPPRKRAKTAEEKEQRKNERILRNRRAADKSRQRQKLAVAELEATKSQMEEENASLRQLVEQYRARFGDIEGFSFTSPPPSTTMSIKTEPQSDLYSASSPMSAQSDYSQSAVSISPNSPMVKLDHISPPLAPTLFPSQDQSQPDFEPQQNLVIPGDFGVDFSGMTQYPAAILCDLQCQPELFLTKSQEAINPKFNLFIQHLNTIHMYTIIFETYSTTMLSPLYQIFQILAETLSMTLAIQDFSNLLDNHFHLLHSLISMPSTPSNPQGLFRMKLLSRLLACSPKMARLLLAATDRALRRVADAEDFAEDPEATRLWASLLTMKWVIVRLEREHRRYRRVIVEDHADMGLLDGVDYGAVERSLRLWKGPDMGKNVQYYHRPELEVH